MSRSLVHSRNGPGVHSHFSCQSSRLLTCIFSNLLQSGMHPQHNPPVSKFRVQSLFLRLLFSTMFKSQFEGSLVVLPAASFPFSTIFLTRSIFSSFLCSLLRTRTKAVFSFFSFTNGTVDRRNERSKRDFETVPFVRVPFTTQPSAPSGHKLTTGVGNAVSAGFSGFSPGKVPFLVVIAFRQAPEENGRNCKHKNEHQRTGLVVCVFWVFCFGFSTTVASERANCQWRFGTVEPF